MNSGLRKIALVRMPFDLQKTSVQDAVKKEILEIINKIPNLQSLKHDTDFLQLVCTLTENSFKKKYKFDKKTFVKDIFKTIWPDLVNEGLPDMMNISSTIEFLHRNGMIKKVPLYRVVTKAVYIFILKMFG
jgi:hypothetical protein